MHVCVYACVSECVCTCGCGVVSRWEELLRYLEPLRPSCARFPEAEYIVKKQQVSE
jgi:hypothetical protein